MTQPVVLPGMADANGTEDDAISRLSRIAAGNANLITHPHLVTALAQSNATPAQAQAINQFIGGMKTFAQVQAARATGTKLALSGVDRASLGALGAHYNDVDYTPDMQAADIKSAQDQVTQQKLKLQASEKSTSGGGGFGLSSIWGGIKTGGGATLSGLQKGWNFVDANLASDPGSIKYIFSDKSALDRSVDQWSSQRRAMQDLGYDPSSIWSVFAFQASGHATQDLTDLIAKNPDTIDTAIQFSANPKKAIEDIASDQSLTPDERGDKLKALNTKEFQDLVRQVGARSATAGDVLTSWIDPVEHPGLQQGLSTGFDLTYQLLLDPTNIAFVGAKVAKISAVGLDHIGDTETVRGVLEGGKGGLYGANVRRGMESFIDNTNALRTATTDADKAAAYARIRTMNPGLEHLTTEFASGQRAVSVGEDGKFIFRVGAPITDMKQATEYLASKIGTTRLMAGRPTLEGRLMPGALSVFGYKQVRGAIAVRSTTRDLSFTNKVIDLRKPGVAARMLPTVDDAVDSAGNVIAQSEDAAAQLASRVRGQAQFEARTTSSGLGVLNPLDQVKAAVNRGRLASLRLTSYLPRDTVISTEDVASVKQVNQYARMFLGRGDADLLAAKYAAADEGVKKSILVGMRLQTLHAAGGASTEAGQAAIKNAALSLTDEAYSAIPGLDKALDTVTGEVRSSAIQLSQANPALKLENFQELQKLSAKIGIWESTVGRMFQSDLVDHVMGAIKGGWLFTGTNFVRNAGEELFHAAVRGDYGDLAAAKAAALNVGDEAADKINLRIIQLQDAARRQPGMAKEFRDQIADLKVQARTARNGLLTNRTRAGNLVAAPFYRVGRAYRHLKINTADESQGLNYIRDLDPELAGLLADNWMKLNSKSMIDIAGINDVRAVTQAGLMPVEMKMTRTGFGPIDVTPDLVGADRYAYTLGQLVDEFPDHADVLISHIKHPDLIDLDHVVASLTAPQHVKRTMQMRFANQFTDETGAVRQAVTDAEKATAIRQLAEKQVEDARATLVGRDGNLNADLVKHIRDTRKAPSSQWILDNLMKGDKESYPRQVLAPMFEATPTKRTLTTLAGELQDVTGRGYQWLVGRPMARVSTMPAFLMNYGRIRVKLAPLEEHLAAQGMGPEAIENALKNRALDEAFHRTVMQVDDPTLRTQMDVVGRNFFAFSRATTAFMRRWGNSFVEDPGRLYRTFTAYEASQHSGFVYNDANGNAQFTYPGSGFMIGAMQKVQSLVPGLNVVQVPGLTSNLTGSVGLLQPGIQNPLQFGLTPMVNIPFRSVEKLFPQHQMAFDEIDRAFNGPGAGSSALGEIAPTAIKKLANALSTDDKNSQLASAQRAAILNLAASGQVPDETADPSVKQRFLTNLQAQTKNTLLLRAAFSFFAPSPPGTPTEETSGSAADFMYAVQGSKSLSDEYKRLLNDSGGDPAVASQIWARIHPDKLMYTVGTTTSSTKSAEFAATASAQSWLETNQKFMKQYGGPNGVAAYFIPLDTQQGDFDLQAYNAEMELGLRQHKGTADYYDDVTQANANTEYYHDLDIKNKALAAHPENSTAINKAWTQHRTEFMATHPAWAATQNNFVAAQATAAGQLATLTNMLKSSNVPKDLPKDAVQDMVDSYNNFHAALTANPGETNAARQYRSTLADSYNDYMQGLVEVNPQLKGLYQGVFRTLDSQTLDSLASAT